MLVEPLVFPTGVGMNRVRVGVRGSVMRVPHGRGDEPGGHAEHGQATIVQLLGLGDGEGQAEGVARGAVPDQLVALLMSHLFNGKIAPPLGTLWA